MTAGSKLPGMDLQSVPTPYIGMPIPELPTGTPTYPVPGPQNIGVEVELEVTEEKGNPPIKPVVDYNQSPGDEFVVNVRVGSSTMPVNNLFWRLLQAPL
jgi:hypothetical protein